MKIAEQIPRRLYALLGLLDEPDEEAYTVIHESIVDFGEKALPYLDEAMLRAKSEPEYRRIEALKEEIVFNGVYRDLGKWLTSGNQPLLDAWIILSRMLNNDASESNTRSAFRSLLKDVWLEFNDRLTALEKVKVINHIFYKVYGFSESEPGETELLSVAENFFRFKKGSPVVMATVYLAVARELFLPVYGVNLPHHLVLAYVDAYGDKKSPHSADDVMFYINPYNKGAIFTRNEIELYLKQNRISPRPDHFAPAGNKIVVMRYLTDLYLFYKKKGDRRKENYIQNLRALIGD